MIDHSDIAEIDYVLLDAWTDRQRANERLADGWQLLGSYVGEGDNGFVEGRVLIGRPASVVPTELNECSPLGRPTGTAA